MLDRFVDIIRLVLPGRDIPEVLEPVLAERVASAVAAWPKLSLGKERLIHAIAHRITADLSAARAIEEIESMQTDDLYLACGCAAGDPAAFAGFEQHCGATIDRAIASSGASPAERADLGQIVRQRLLVKSADGTAPRITGYSARGSLRTWVRVVATRETARMLSRPQREVAAEDDELASWISRDDDPEIGYLKRLYREEFRRAFHAAVEALGDRARLMLRQHTLDGLSIDRLAALHGVHRVTAARWVEAAREALLAGTQRELSRRLHLNRSELASVIRLIQSQLEVSLARVLR